MGAASANTAEAEQLAITHIRRILRKLASVTDLADPVRLAGLTDRAFRQEFPAEAQTDNRLANAVARGIPSRQKLIQDEGGSLSAEKTAELLGISKPAILKRYQNGQIVAWREEKQNAVRFPAWQFVDGKLLPGIKEVLAVLNQGAALDDLGKLLFFLSTPRSLAGKRPLDLLRDGRLSEVLKAAQVYAE